MVNIWLMMVNDNLVGGFNHLEKYKFVNGKDDIPYMKWKLKVMFETTNQIGHIFQKVTFPISSVRVRIVVDE